MHESPTDVKVKRADGTLLLTWPDGSTSTISLRRLRQECRCAHCIDERTGRPILDPESVPPDVSVTSMKPVGNYALAFTFTDGHDTGIYSWKHLRQISAST